MSLRKLWNLISIQNIISKYITISIKNWTAYFYCLASAFLYSIFSIQMLLIYYIVYINKFSVSNLHCHNKMENIINSSINCRLFFFKVGNFTLDQRVFTFIRDPILQFAQTTPLVCQGIRITGWNKNFLVTKWQSGLYSTFEAKIVTCEIGT